MYEICALSNTSGFKPGGSVPIAVRTTSRGAFEPARAPLSPDVHPASPRTSANAQAKAKAKARAGDRETSIVRSSAPAASVLLLALVGRSGVSAGMRARCRTTITTTITPGTSTECTSMGEHEHEQSTGTSTIIHDEDQRFGYTGKVAGLIYDRTGAFDGFLLDTDDGERAFDSREPGIEDVANRAWAERILTTVYADAAEPWRPVRIVLRA